MITHDTTDCACARCVQPSVQPSISAGCTCDSCTDWRSRNPGRPCVPRHTVPFAPEDAAYHEPPLGDVETVSTELPATVAQRCSERADDGELRDALRDLVAAIDNIGGYMTPEHQAVLWRARRLSR